MATRLTKAQEGFIQYSKRMCTAVCIFWMIYRILNFIVVLVRPETVNALADLCAGVDTIMIVNMSTYCLNSTTEKVAIAVTKRKSLYDPTPVDSDDDEKSKEDKEVG